MNTLEEVSLSSGLYLVATPIGNLRDITLRALDVLNSVDMILCEDTRVTGKLLKAFDIKKGMQSYNDHNADKTRGSVLEKLSNGGKIALVSDAGMPLISDPGYKLVRDCLDLGLFVTSIPGASASLMALQLSGLPSDKFCFLGFMPPKSEARKKVLKTWESAQGTLVIYESGPRLIDSLSDMLEVLGDRPASVVRELTKLYEEKRHDTLENLIEFYEEDGVPKGEIVIVVSAPEEKVYDEASLKELLAKALTEHSVKDAAAQVAEQTGQSKKQLYDMALQLKNDES